jgi:hypothetical protein
MVKALVTPAVFAAGSLDAGKHSVLFSNEESGRPMLRVSSIL